MPLVSVAASQPPARGRNARNNNNNAGRRKQRGVSHNVVDMRQFVDAPPPQPVVVPSTLAPTPLSSDATAQLLAALFPAQFVPQIVPVRA
jgi:hypothetical protein